jgi:RNA polymerase sigma factor (sigma-70 family)
MMEAVLAFRAAPRGERFMKEAAETSDESLLARVAGGNEAALGELYDRFGRVAYGLALRVLRDDRLAEDAVQEAFLAVWRQAASYRPDRAKAQTWVLTLVHRRAVDLVRREERRRADSLDPEFEPAGSSAAEDAESRDRRAAVQRALAELPEEQRRPIELAYYGGLTQSELAERLGEPLGTIKSRMFTGLKRLRELIGDEF